MFIIVNFLKTILWLLHNKEVKVLFALTEVTKQFVWSSIVVVIVWMVRSSVWFLLFIKQIFSILFFILQFLNSVCSPWWRWSEGKISLGSGSWKGGCSWKWPDMHEDDTDQDYWKKMKMRPHCRHLFSQESLPPLRTGSGFNSFHQKYFYRIRTNQINVTEAHRNAWPVVDNRRRVGRII